jgi:hypothetical protein
VNVVGISTVGRDVMEVGVTGLSSVVEVVSPTKPELVLVNESVIINVLDSLDDTSVEMVISLDVASEG